MKNKPLARFYRATKFAIIGFATEYAFSITLELQSSEMTTICAIRAIYYGKQSSLLAGCNLDPIKMSNAVDLTLLQINPTHTILRYSSTQTSVGLALSGGFDIENVESLVLATRLVVIRVEEDQCTNAIFKILLLDDFLHLKECLLWCKELCDLTLRVDCLARDYYFAGVYSVLQAKMEEGEENLETDNKSSKAQELEGLHNFSALLPSSLNFSFLQPDSLQEEDLIHEEATGTAGPDIICAYCQDIRKGREVDYFVHPYLPSNYMGEQLAMCAPCIDAWWKYREAARRTKELILEGEVNEELCCVCSATPELIVMCSSCVRSFCESCLALILSPEDMFDLKTNVNWSCCICAQGLLHSDPLPPAKWSKIPLTKKTFSPYHFERQVLRSPQKRQLIPVEPVNTKEDYPSVKNLPKESPQPIGVLTRVSPLPIRALIKEPALSIAGPRGEYLKKKRKREADRQRHLLNSLRKRQSTALVSPFIPTSTAGVEVQPKDAEWYFAEYVLLCQKLDAARERLVKDTTSYRGRPPCKSGAPLPAAANGGGSEDYCFLCKDGGDLIECEHQSKNKVCCKVYHTYCLAYYNENADPNVKWICGRHFCDICGNKYSVKFACRFCPLSFCEGNCAVKFAAEHGSRFISLPRELEASAIAWSSNQNVSLIICHACITLVEACVERGLLPAGILKGRSIQQLDAMALPSDTSSQHRLEGESIINEEGNAVCDNCDEWTEDDFLTLRQAVRLFPEPLFADRKLQVICPAAVTRALGAPEHVWLLERYSMEEICAKVLEINQPGHSSAYRLRAAPSSVTSTSDPKTVNISTVTLSAMSGKEQEVIPPSSWTMEHFQLLGLALKAYPLKENDAFNMPLYVYHRITTDPAYCELARYSHSSCKIATRRLLTSASHKNESSQVTTAAISSDAHVKNE